MRDTVRVVFGLAALILIITLGQRLFYATGQYTNTTLSSVIELADKYNARQDPKVVAYLKEVDAGAPLDIERLRILLKPGATKAGQLVRLRKDLENLAKGESVASAGVLKDIPMPPQPRNSKPPTTRVEPTPQPHAQAEEEAPPARAESVLPPPPPKLVAS